ncbi:hypothetical protein [Zooshikella sp. RANM57]|uniref:hypothetical protein n=1 Tax=Zooshikella sp. RANM57 TaxID=3425863 RepID=UPI003D6F5A3F
MKECTLTDTGFITTKDDSSFDLTSYGELTMSDCLKFMHTCGVPEDIVLNIRDLQGDCHRVSRIYYNQQEEGALIFEV